MRYINLLFFTFILFSLIGQNTKDLYMHREYRSAYGNATRSYLGLPGAGYFQNSADYNIQAEFFPDTKMIVGSEVITYTNNSPDSLSWLYINLYQNRFKKGEARDANVDPRNIHNGVNIKSIKVLGKQIDSSEMTFYSTLLVIPVQGKIPPDSEAKIEIEWSLSLPVTGMFRSGTYDESSFFAGNWYPKISVYDDIVGWNSFGHTGNAEFYNDYGDFKVEITAPAHYNIWSSGLLQNADEIYRDKFLARINKASLFNEVVEIIGREDRMENKITKQAEKHTWKFEAVDFPDFAFALSDKYLWDATSADIGQRRVLVNSVYNPRSEKFKLVAEVSRKSVEYYSNTIPAIPYPYPQITVFNGESRGQEYPGIVNNQNENSEMGTVFLTTHEIAHAYFPFYVGTNEQEYAWMDEGLVSLIGFAAMAEIMGVEEATIFEMARQKYNEGAGRLAIDIPLMSGTHAAGDFTYGFITYTRPIVAFNLLHEYMGEDKFYQALRLFTNHWKGKHPIPYDLFYTFNEVAGEDLAWFWKPWFFELGYSDVGIGDIEYMSDKTIVHIENNGTFPIPVTLLVKYMDGSEKKVCEKMNIWQNGNRTQAVEIPKGTIQELVLDANSPELYYDNNRKIVNESQL
jgi:hypothetical protein